MKEHNYIIINNVKVKLNERHFDSYYHKPSDILMRERALLFLTTIGRNMN